MTGIDNEELLKALAAVEEAQERVRALTEDFVRHRIAGRNKLDPGEFDALIERIYRHLFGAVGAFDLARSPKPTSAFSWFMTCVDHAAADWARRNKKVVLQPLLGPKGEEPPDTSRMSLEAEHKHKSALDDLCSALAQLKTDWEREILLLPLLLGRIDYPRIVQIMDLPSIGDARVRMYRAREHMKDILAGLGWDPDRVADVFR